MISRNGQKVSDPRSDEKFFHLLRNISLFTQNQGLKDGGRGWPSLFLQEVTDMIPPGLDPQEDGIFKSLADFHPHLLLGEETDHMDSFKGEIAFIGEDARVMKSMGAIEFTEKPETISKMKGPVLLFSKKEETAFHRNVTVR